MRWLIAAGLLLTVTHAFAGNGLSLGARGPGTTMVSITGLDTKDAVLVAEVTRTNMNECISEEGQACSVRRLQIGVRFTFRANCETGRVVDTDGRHFTRISNWGRNDLFAGRPRFSHADGTPVSTANSDVGGPLAVNFEAACPTMARITPTASQHLPLTKPTSGAAVLSLSSLSGTIFDHNGSSMLVDTDNGIIVYQEPGSSIAGTVRPGQVLFRGTLVWRSATPRGVAYTFKKGCEPAPYKVTGHWSLDGSLILQGAAPIRAKNGCTISAHETKGGNATLRFTSRMSP